MRDRLRNLSLRVLSAVFLGGVFIASLIWAGPLFDLLVLLFSAGAFYEWLRLVRPAHNAAISFIGAVYISLTFLSLIALRRSSSLGWQEVVFLFTIVWGTDTAAYMCGRLIGGPKLIPRISPNKTWAGSVGGLIGGIIAGQVANYYLLHCQLAEILALTVGLAVLTQIGDLFESALKRRFQVKDSGWFIPGHGGILDRIDGLLLAAPVFAVLHFWIKLL